MKTMPMVKHDVDDCILFGRQHSKLAIIMTISVIQSIVLIVIVIQSRDARHHALAPTERELCVPMSSLEHVLYTEVGVANIELHVAETEELRVEAEDKKTGNISYCGRASVVFDLLIRETLYESGFYNRTDEVPPVRPEECTIDNKETASGHEFGIDIQKVKYDKSNKVHWKSIGMPLKGGIQYTDGHFIVNEAGFYYITSQVLFSDPDKTSNTDNRDNTTTGTNTDDGTFRHFLYKIGNGQENPEMILEGATTFCDTFTDNPEASSNIGAIFKLDKGDKVFVKTSHPNHLISSDASNHFSLHMF